MFYLTEGEIERMHGPVGLDGESKTSAEIPASLLGEVAAVTNSVSWLQQKRVIRPVMAALQSEWIHSNL
ncbi:hypothetical protein [Polaromonas sp. UBA4122]|uniref:hypothetical protein n=1 Tax=Polaromonas sp. UBA4122 TaxID=1947074 RepID=UPI0025CF0B04|nr:hypothetical protein [Polaromonas sp. UBA4122]